MKNEEQLSNARVFCGLSCGGDCFFEFFVNTVDIAASGFIIVSTLIVRRLTEWENG
jgi:hypothetical protein